jgi:hypothetical protein
LRFVVVLFRSWPLHWIFPIQLSYLKGFWKLHGWSQRSQSSLSTGPPFPLQRCLCSPQEKSLSLKLAQPQCPPDYLS